LPPPIPYNDAQPNQGAQCGPELEADGVGDIGLPTEDSTGEIRPTPQRQPNNQEIITTDLAEDTTPTLRRQSKRHKKKTKFYDASTGESVHANDGAELEGDA